MSKWSVKIQSSGGLARVNIFDGEKTVGVVTMPLRSYHDACKELIITLTGIAQAVISDALEKRLWQDAQSMTMGLDAEAAMHKMEAFGWTKEKVERYATELALTLGQSLVEHLPEHMP